MTTTNLAGGMGPVRKSHGYNNAGIRLRTKIPHAFSLTPDMISVHFMRTQRRDSRFSAACGAKGLHAYRNAQIWPLCGVVRARGLPTPEKRPVHTYAGRPIKAGWPPAYFVDTYSVSSDKG